LGDPDPDSRSTGWRYEAHDITSRERTCIVNHEIIPFPARPWTLNGISERMLVSHYENDY
jgi:hypothetical protein